MRRLPGGDVANFYTVQALNRTSEPAVYRVTVLEPDGAAITPLGAFGSVAPYSVADGRFLIRYGRAARRREHASAGPRRRPAG